MVKLDKARPIAEQGTSEFAPGVVRALLACATLCSIAFVIYASLVPLRYVAKPVDEVWREFDRIPWLELGIDQRADWVANGLMMIPCGFFAAAAIDWKRKRRWPLLLATPFIICPLMAIVVAIEWVQICFPPRVVSQNDIFAGVIGSAVGVPLWWISGRRLILAVEQFLLSKPGIQKWRMLSAFGILGLLIYNVMPFDLLLSTQEAIDKWNTGVTLLPGSDLQLSKYGILSLAIAGLRIVPYTFFTTLCCGKSTAIRHGILLAILVEIIKFPVHSRAVSLTDILASVVGAIAAALLAHPFLRALLFLDRATCWFLGSIGWSGVMLLGFLGRYSDVLHDQEMIRSRLIGIWIVPFARAHSSSEFAAGENIILKVAVFATLAFLLSGWCSRLSGTWTRSAMSLSVFWCLTIEVGIELAQVFLPPLVPDVTDFIVYTIGVVVGIIGFRMMIPNRESHSLPSKSR
jgi:VanZ family protein